MSAQGEKVREKNFQSYEEREIWSLIGALSIPNQERVMELVGSLARASAYATVQHFNPVRDERDHLAEQVRRMREALVKLHEMSTPFSDEESIAWDALSTGENGNGA